MRVNPNNEATGVTGIPGRTAAQKPRLGQDKVALDNADHLNQALEQTPVVRTDKVEQAKGLVQNVAYPPDVVIHRIAVLLAMHLDNQDDSSSK